PDIICGAGPGARPEIKVFSGKTGTLLRDSLAFGGNFAGGVYVSAADLNKDGKADVIVGAGAGALPEVMVFDGSDLASRQVLASFFAYPQSFGGGVRVDVADVNKDGAADILTGAGPGGGPQVSVFDGTTLMMLDSLFGFIPSFSGGIFV